MNKWRPWLNSINLKDPKISFHRILIIISRSIIGEKVEYKRNFQISEIENIFAYNINIKRIMNKRRSGLDSAYLKDSKIPFYRILIIIENYVSDEEKELNYIFYDRYSSNI